MTSTLSHTVTGARRDRVAYLNHPMGAEGSFWDAFTAEIGEELATIAPDQYGAGRSAEITGPVSLERHVQDMEQLRRHLGLERMIVVGCAIGGMIGASYAALYPQHVSALVMTNPGLKTRDAARQALALRAQAVRSGGMDAVIPAATDAAFHGCPEDARKAAYVAQFRVQNPVNYAATIESILDLDLTETYRRIACPVLLVPGGHDRLFTPDHADEIKALIPQAELVLLEQGAHFIPYQVPRDFADCLRAFLARHRL